MGQFNFCTREKSPIKMISDCKEELLSDADFSDTEEIIQQAVTIAKNDPPVLEALTEPAEDSMDSVMTPDPVLSPKNKLDELTQFYRTQSRSNDSFLMDKPFETFCMDDLLHQYKSLLKGKQCLIMTPSEVKCYITLCQSDVYNADSNFSISDSTFLFKSLELLQVKYNLRGSTEDCLWPKCFFLTN